MTPKEWAAECSRRIDMAGAEVSPSEVVAVIVSEAVAARDMEWWQACCLVDSVAPTPEAVRHCVAAEQQHWIAEAVAAERERIIGAIRAAGKTGNLEDHDFAVYLAGLIADGSGVLRSPA